MTERAALRHGRSLLPWALIVLLAGLNLLYVGRLGANDDAFITYRVARNLADGLGPVFNPGERVLSITTPGYMLALAALAPFSRDFPLLGLALNGLATLAIGGLLIDLSRPAASRWSGLAAALLAATLTLTFDLFSKAVGMETPLYVAALLATFAAYGRALRRLTEADRWLNWTAMAAAAAFLLRPDGALAGIAVGLHWLIVRRSIPWRAMGLGLLLSLPWPLFAWAYYGSPVPNTLPAKISQGLSVDAARWGPELIAVAQDWASAHPVAALLALIGLLAAFWQRRDDRLPLLLWALLFIAAHTWLDVRSYYWYYVPLIPVVALLAGDGLAWLLGWLAGRARPRPTPGAALPSPGRLTLAALLLAAAFYPSVLAAANLAARPEPRQRETAYRQTALALKSLCTGGRPVGMAEIGLIGYISDCRVLDFSGLLQPELARLRLSALDKMIWAIKAVDPPLIVLSGGENYPHAISDASWFRQRYEVIDNQDERGFFSAIYQRQLGPARERRLSGAARFPAHAAQCGPVEETLAFPLAASPAITLHAYLPAGSMLTAAIDGQILAEFAGEEAAWRDYRLPSFGLQDGAARLELAGQGGDQPAAVAWIESNAWPSVHYFGPWEEAGQRPRPTIPLDPGQSRRVTLAPAGAGPVILEVLHRDRPGVELAVRVDGQEIGVIGGEDGWRLERLPLPESAELAREIELLSQGQQFARIAYVALVPRTE